MDFGAESAPSIHEGVTPYTPLPGGIFTIGPAEDICGDLVTCDIDDNAREAVMAEMVVAGDSEIGADKWFQNAVELSHFYIGDPTEDLTVCAQKTVERINAFISPG
eukprot:2069002-Heterocapsa_arctica.AAC.1